MSIEVRDAIHGLIAFTPAHWTVIDTLAFQRLRGVQQLAMTHLVYPGARHTRFEHCLGASHVASLTADRIKKDGQVDIDPHLVSLAGLVHDIGHGPFSHISEEVFARRTGREHIHEAISAAIVRHDRGVRAALGDELSESIAELLTGTGHALGVSVAKDIVAGPADIDKLDYLLRDSHYCGVEYGRYDLEKVVESARGIPEVGKRSRLAFHEEGIYALEEMLLARYHMHRQVYGHRTRVATDRMLVRAMSLGVDEGMLPQEIFTPPSNLGPEFVSAFLAFDDQAVAKTLCAARTPGGEVMRALMGRRLFKRLIRLDFKSLEDQFQRQLAGYVASPDETVLRAMLPEVEAAIASRAGVDPHWVVLHWEKRESPISTRFDLRVAGRDIMIVDDDGTPSVFHERSEVFQRVEGQGEVFISLYVRPANDVRPSEGDLDRIRDVTFEGLEAIGKAAAEP
jgi:HD superfamily phosphohydrolase